VVTAEVEENDMRAAVFHGRGDVRIDDVPVPRTGPGDLLVRIAAVGICGTDAHEYSTGPHMFPITEAHPVSGHVGPMIPGHELAGVVEAVGEDVTEFGEGDLVVSGAGISCGECHWCVQGRTNLCARYSTVGLQRDGGLAQYAIVPASTCVAVADYGLTPDAAALGQPMSIAVHSMRRGRLEPGEVAVLIGAGGIGAFLTYAATERGATVVVSDLDAGRLEIARSLGATATVNPAEGQSLGDVLADHQWVPSVVYEVSGTVSGLEAAFEVATRGTRVVLVGLQAEPGEIDYRSLTLSEIELIGTNALVKAADVPEALRLLASRPGGWRDVAPEALALDDLVTDGLMPLVERRSTRIKTLIDPWAETSRSTEM
jgi:(R,R)-butanediol dehydrogenase/meso-butanediol dehydrogenase/diacetyl reductase